MLFWYTPKKTKPTGLTEVRGTVGIKMLQR